MLHPSFTFQIIFKLDKWRLEKRTEEAGPSIVTAPAPRIEKTYRRSKLGNQVSPKKGLLPLPAVSNDSPSHPSRPANKGGVPAENTRQSGSEVSSKDNGVAQDTCKRDPLIQTPKAMSKKKLRVIPKRKAGSLRGLLALNPVPRSPLEEPARHTVSRNDATTSGRGIPLNPQKEVSTSGTKGGASLDRRRERTKPYSARHLRRLAKKKLDAQKLLQQKEGIVEAAPGAGLREQEITRRMLKSVSAGKPKLGSLPGTRIPEPAENRSHALGSSKKLSTKQSKVTVPATDKSTSNFSQSPPSKKKKGQIYSLPSAEPVVLEHPVADSEMRLLRSGRRVSLRQEATPSSLPLPEPCPCNGSPAHISSEIASSHLEGPAAVCKTPAATLPRDRKTSLLQLPDPLKIPGVGLDSTTCKEEVPPSAQSSRTASMSLQERETTRGVGVKEAESKGANSNMPQEQAHVDAVMKPERVFARVNGPKNASGAKVTWLNARTGEGNVNTGYIKPMQPLPNLSSAPLRSYPSLFNGTLQKAALGQTSTFGSSVPVVRTHEESIAKIKEKLEEAGGLTDWLVESGLGVFVGLFEERKIDEAALLQLTMDSLKEMGVQAVGPRRKLMWVIQHLL